jgi:FAD/FMN-containing dehydrogenase
VTWPYAHAAAAIEVWQDWAPDGPDELAASLLVNAPADHEEPVVTLFGAMLGGETETASTLDELIVRLGADPASATLEQTSHGAAKRFLAEQAPGAERHEASTDVAPSRASLMRAKSEFFCQPLPAEAIAALVDAFAVDRAAGQARELDFTPWAGAYNRVRPDATAFAHRGESFLLKHATVLNADASRRERAAQQWLVRSWSLADPYGSGAVFPNFADPDLIDWATAYHGANYDRLTRVKARYDPDNAFRFDQSVPPTGR